MAVDKGMKPATRLIHAGRNPEDHHGSVNPPIYRASTILMRDMASWDEARRPNSTEYRYGLIGTPTSRAFEAAIAEFYGVSTCVAVNSGLAMITVTLLALTKAGDHILVTDSVYDPTRRFCDQTLRRFGVTTTYYDPTIGAGIADLIRPKTSVIFTESPGSLTFEVQDIPAIAGIAHQHGIKIVIDNTWATALRFNPFDHGVDIVLEAATKYIGGHSDVLLGVILSNDAVGKTLFSTAKELGICCGPEELYLGQRGLRTLKPRLDQSEHTGLVLARWLSARPEVKTVLHPAFPDCPGHAFWKRDFSGSSGLFSVILHPMAAETLANFMNAFKLFGLGVSWGGYESLVITADPRQIRTATPWTESGPLVRFYAGLEDPDDLIADLAQAFETISPST